MALSRKLFVNWQTKTLQLSDESATPVSPPTFQKYETLPLEVVIVEPCPPWDPNDFERIDITNLSLTVAINDTLDDSSPLASNSTWTKNTAENTFSGELALNTAGFNTWIGSSAEKTAYLEIEVTEGATARTKIYTNTITVKGSLLPPTTTTPDPLKEYYTKQEMEGIFATWKGRAGQTITLVSPDGANQRILGAINGGVPQDDMLPN